MKKIVTIVTIIMFTFFLHSQTIKTNHNNLFTFSKFTKVNIDNQGPNVDSFIGGEIFLEGEGISTKKILIKITDKSKKREINKYFFFIIISNKCYKT